jgi:probable rRNA maturation factor
MEAQSSRPEGMDAGIRTVASDDNYWISVQIEPAYEAALDADHLHALACFVLQAESRRGPLEIGITITTDQEIHSLNKQYLAHDYATDVLSFGAEGGPRAAGSEEPDPDATEGAEVDTVPAPDYITEGYEGDVESSGAAVPLDDEDDAEGADSDSAQALSVGFVTPPGWPTYLGDVVISYDTAAAQAADYGHPPTAEVDVLLVHGLLHLLGYDDTADADRTRMHARQDEILGLFTK